MHGRTFGSCENTICCQDPPEHQVRIVTPSEEGTLDSRFENRCYTQTFVRHLQWALGMVPSGDADGIEKQTTQHPGWNCKTPQSPKRLQPWKPQCKSIVISDSLWHSQAEKNNKQTKAFQKPVEDCDELLMNFCRSTSYRDAFTPSNSSGWTSFLSRSIRTKNKRNGTPLSLYRIQIFSNTHLHLISCTVCMNPPKETRTEKMEISFHLCCNLSSIKG